MAETRRSRSRFGKIEVALEAIADFVHLKSPELGGHSRAVGRIAEQAGAILGLAQVRERRRSTSSTTCCQADSSAKSAGRSAASAASAWTGLFRLN